MIKNSLLLLLIPGIALAVLFSGVISADAYIITGRGEGPGNNALVRRFMIQGTLDAAFLAYGYQDFGVRVAAGDLDGTGGDEVVTAPGPGRNYGPVISCFDQDGERMCVFLAYGTKHWGAKVTCGDVDGDHRAEIITAPGPGPAFGGHC